MNKFSTTQLGLPETESQVYSFLITTREATIREIAEATGIQRTHVYNIVKQLEIKRLITAKPEAPVTTYAALEPSALRVWTAQQVILAQQAVVQTENLFPLLTSAFTKAQNAPSVRTYEGIAGLYDVYKEILHSKTKKLSLMRSSSDNTSSEYEDAIDWMRIEEKKHGIQVRIFGQPGKAAKKHWESNEYAKNNTTRRFSSSPHMANPAQIMIWNDCVALTSFEGAMLTTVIEHEMIATTFENIFEYCWGKAESEHQEIVSHWKASA